MPILKSEIRVYYGLKHHEQTDETSVTRICSTWEIFAGFEKYKSHYFIRLRKSFSLNINANRRFGKFFKFNLSSLNHNLI